MGTVYRAFDRDRKIEVALKTLTSASGKALYRFKREFRVLADVVHPNLVTLYELHTLGGDWFITMELIEGVPFISYVRPYVTPVPPMPPPLDTTISETGEETRDTGLWRPPPQGRERIIKGTLNTDRLDRALYQLADGVFALHRAGKLHRDLKPSNVLVDSPGRVVLLDFGLTAEVAGMREEMTHDMAAVGTPIYMSPEQAADLPLSDASDWYSVGVMLYEALTGYRPFEGQGEQIYVLKQTRDPPRPGELAPDVPPQLDELCMRLLDRDPDKRPAGDEVIAVLHRRPSPATLHLGAAKKNPPFIGRQKELKVLRTALEQSRQGRGMAVLIRGQSGMGKSALMRRFLAEVTASTDAAILRGRCYERETVPYKALDAAVDALTQHLLALPAEEVDKLLPRDITALAKLFPVLRRVPSIANPSRRTLGEPDPHELRRRAFIALRYLLQQIADIRPVILYIDDLQWGDEDSASFLRDLIHTADPPSLLLVVSYRLEDEETSKLPTALRRPAPSSAGGGVTTELTIGPLPVEEAAALVREIAGVDAERAEALAREAGESTLFLAELARASADAGGPGEGVSLDDILRSRIERLDDDARRLLQMTAVAGRPVRPGLVIRAAGIAGEGPPLSQLRVERLIRSRRSADDDLLIEPYHNRIRAAALAAVGDELRRELHRSFAKALEQDGNADAEVLVEHWLGAGELAKVGLYAARAAQDAEDTLLFHRAADLYALAIEHGAAEGDELRALRRRHGDALTNAGRLDAAADAYAAAAKGADRDQGIELRRLQLEQLLRRGRTEDGFALAEQVLGEVGVSMPRGHTRTLLSIVGQRMLVRLRGLDAKARESEDVDPKVRQRLDVCWSAASAMAFVQPFYGRVLALRFMRTALKGGDRADVVKALCLELGFLALGGSSSWKQAQVVRDRVLVAAEALGDPAVTSMVQSGSGIASFLNGRWNESLDLLIKGEHGLGSYNSESRWQMDLNQIFHTSALLYLGRLEELVRLVPMYLREAEERGDVYAARGLRGWRSNVVWLVLDRPEEARANAEAVATGGRFHLHHYYELLAMTQIDLYEGKLDDAWERVREVWRALGKSMLLRIQSVRIEGNWLRARAALASAGNGDAPDRLSAAEQSMRSISRERIAWAAPVAALVGAAIAHRRGDDRAAIATLRAAIAGFDEVDMALHAMCARWQLGRLVGGDDGAEIERQAAAWMAEQEVVAPERIVALFAPGFG